MESADDIELGGPAKTLKDRIRIEKDLDGLESWALDGGMKLSTDKCTSLPLG